MPFLALKKLIPPGVDQNLVCGIDEVGRGPWAGPLVACALMFRTTLKLPGLNESKQLSAAEREKFYEILMREADVGVGVSTVEEVDRFGLLKANNMAFIRALEQLPRQPDFLLIDGRDRLKMPYPHKTIIKGDAKIKLIACASIIAKVTRDRMMDELDAIYPHYGFRSHKGYGTKQHQDALKKHGACPLHRRSFAPVHQLLQQTLGLGDVSEDFNVL